MSQTSEINSQKLFNNENNLKLQNLAQKYWELSAQNYI